MGFYDESMATGDTRTRVPNQRAITDAKIEEAALALLASVGTDGLTLPAIAKEADLTTGPVYARYSGIDDVLVVLWDSRLRDELIRIINLQLNWVNSNRPLPDDLRQLLEDAGREPNALVELMATLRRYPFAFSVIQPQIDEIFESVANEHSDIPRAVLQQQLGFVLGTVFAKPIFASTFADSVIEAALLLQEMSLARVGWSATSVPGEPIPVPIPAVETEEPVRKAFLEGALQTIAVTGLEGASAQRIARAAGYGFSTAYSYFRSKEELAQEALEIVIRQLFVLNRDSDGIQEHDDYVQRIVGIQRGALSEAGRPLRQLRVECVVAARHSPRIRKFAQSRFSEVLVFAAHRNSGRRKGKYSMIATWSVIATHNFALPLVSGCTRYLDGADWAPIAEQLYFVRHNFRA